MRSSTASPKSKVATAAEQKAKRPPDTSKLQPLLSCSLLRLRQLLLLELRILDGLATQVRGNAQEAVVVVQGLVTEQTRLELSGRVGGALVRDPQIAKPAEHGVLEPAEWPNRRDDGDGFQAVGDIGELDV